MEPLFPATVILWEWASAKIPPKHRQAMNNRQLVVLLIYYRFVVITNLHEKVLGQEPKKVSKRYSAMHNKLKHSAGNACILISVIVAGICRLQHVLPEFDLISQ